jgi:hypothetical protein
LRTFAYLVLVRLLGVLTDRGSVSQLQLENAALRHPGEGAAARSGVQS